jgi:hypothetical protein
MKIHIFNLKGRLHKTDEPPTKRLCLDDEGEQMDRFFLSAKVD